MRWLYRLQTRLGLTAPEGAAALVVVVVLATGVVAGEVQSDRGAVPPDFYAASDAAFAAASAAADSGDTALAAPLAFAAVPETMSPEGAPDTTTAAGVAEAVIGETSPRQGKPPPVRTDLNTASAEALQRLPGIGPALAQRVLDYRREHGRFRTPDEIVEVKGIGPKTLEKLRPWIYVR